MRIATKLFAGIALVAAAPGALQAAPLICSLSSIRSCDELTGCEPVLHEEFNVPRFWKVDLEKKTITGTRPDGSQASTPSRARTCSASRRSTCRRPTAP